MPVMDGFQFLRGVKKDPSLSSIPFVFYSSSYKGDQDVRLAMSLGAEAYFIKPVDPVELWDKIRRLLGAEKSASAAPAVRLVQEDAEYLRRYSEVVATKLEEKVRELELTLTERQRAEEALRERDAFIRTVLDSVDEGFIVVDRQYRILSANRAFCRLMKLPEDRIIGRTCHEISHHLPRPCFEMGEDCAVHRTFETGGTHFVSHTHTGEDGAKQYMELSSYPITDASGAVVSAIETVNDVTDRRKLEEQLVHSQRLESLGTLAGGVAHDFNNILNVIVGYGGIMEMKTAPDDPNRAYIREILAASDRAARLTQALLIFSRKQTVELKPVSINDLVRGMTKMVERIIGEDIETKIALAPQELTVMGDYGQLEQVLMNFATNARDAMPKGGTLTIETRFCDLDEEFTHTHECGSPGRYAVISVSDTGEGMDETIRGRIFEPFFTTKGPGKGTGLGLSIVYGIVRQHKGCITCSTVPGRGTAFTVYLPIVDEMFRDPGGEEAEPVRGGTETILVADDDENIRKLSREVLEQHGYAVIEARDGEDAVSRFVENRERVRLLLLDVIMPRKGGKEAFDEIARIRPGVPVLFMSGYAEDYIQRKEVFEESLPMLWKPVKLRELLSRVREMLDGAPP
jgi:PAS domain S-box-containing protein